jgi:hypothetical protein
MKQFLIYTSIVEAITGILLVVLPVSIVSFLFEIEFNDKVGIILSMIAGAAIFSLSLICWLLRDHDVASLAVQGLLAYNASITVILLYGRFSFGLQGWVLWSIIIFHGVQSLQCLRFLRKKVIVTDSM